MSNFYDLSAQTIDGQMVPLSQYKGKVALVVNVASQCGFTPQYKGLEELYRQYRDRGLVILGFPSNDFGAQEPGTAEQIKQFCTSRYDVDFDLFAKIKVKGTEKAEVYRYLTETLKQEVQWNFNKFLVDREGNVTKYYPSTVAPNNSKLIQDLEAML
ncbi:MAG: glutathione peroxidase [Oscillatoriales cyanobacterium SM2_2_1]|nr:glutathione peroxidase [Oscillatoriales cyanobacterium SM2_2_1]